MSAASNGFFIAPNAARKSAFSRCERRMASISKSFRSVIFYKSKQRVCGKWTFFSFYEGRASAKENETNSNKC